MTEPRDLERMITATARAMTAHDLPRSLRPAVLGRLGDRRPARRSWWLAVAAVGAAAAVVTLIVADRRHDRIALPLKPADAPTVLAARRVPVIETNSPQPALNRAIGTRDRSTREDANAWRDQVLPRLPLLPALELPNTGIQPAALGIAQLDVKPIGVAPLVVAPIDGSMPR